MNGILNWVAATIALTLTVMVLCFYTLHVKGMYADRNIELTSENDSLKSMNNYLTVELCKARQQLKNYEKEPPLAKINMPHK